MASLHKLLSQDGFERQISRNPNNRVALPIFICHHRKSFDSSSPHKPAKPPPPSARGFSSETSNSKAPAGKIPAKDEPAAIDGVSSFQAVVSVFSGYVEQYSKHEIFRRNIRERCRFCLENGSARNTDDEILAHLEMGIESIDRTIEIQELRNGLDLESLQKSIKILKTVASFSSNTCLSACAHLYLSVAYHIAKNDKVSARCLLKVFSQSPYLARTCLLPELWELVFLHHLHHIIVWRENELHFFLDFGYREKKIQALNEQCNHLMDIGTIKFALYYKDWLKFGGQSPYLPSLPSPSKSSFSPSRRKSLDPSAAFHATSDKCLYRMVIHPVAKTRSTTNTQCYLEDENGACCDEEDEKINRAISTICSSESLSECEKAVRLITEAWLNPHPHGGGTIDISLSRPPVIHGIMEILCVSTDDEILELAISLLAGLVAKNETNRLWVLNSDQNLDISIKLFRSSNLFLKAAALLYLIKPKAKQMVSTEWVALVLRVLEFGDHLEILFDVKCYTHEAAYYFLDELLTGFDEDKNFENAQQIVSLGGLSLLVRRMDEGDFNEKTGACAVIHRCVKADRSCRYYLSKNLKKARIISLLALGMKTNSYDHALGLMTELLCLGRRNQITEGLTELKRGWDCLNTMHVLLFLLQRARPEERPIVAVILLQLDLMEDTREYSVYREEAVDAIIKALEYRVFDERNQELAARALLILGGHFSYAGEPDVERWLLRKAAHEDNVISSFCQKDVIRMNEEDKSMENWQRKTATALLRSGKTRLLAALSGSIGNSIPCLARASLVTACWVSIGLQDEDLQLRRAAYSILGTPLIDCLVDNSPSMDDKILASFSLYNLTKGTDKLYRNRMEEVMGCLNKLSRATWTAGELLSLITRK